MNDKASMIKNNSRTDSKDRARLVQLIDKYSRVIFQLSVLITLCLMVWITPSLIFYKYACDWGTIGQIGDSFGAVNAFFSGLAMFGVYQAVKLQKTELQESRKSFEIQLKSAKQTLDLERLNYYMQNEPNLIFSLSIDIDDNTYFSMKNHGKDAINLYLILMDENVIPHNTENYYYEDNYFPIFSKTHSFQTLIADHIIKIPFLRIELMYTNQMGLFISKSIIMDTSNSNQKEILNSYLGKLDVEDLAFEINYNDYLKRISELKTEQND